MSAPRPPRLALAMLEALLPEESRDAVIGDLVEAHAERAATNRFTAWLRFWRESLAAVTQLQIVPPLASAFTPYTTESLVQSFLSDVRHAGRILWRARGFTVVCATTLGIAIGATTAIYSIVSPVLLVSLPYPHPERILSIWERNSDGTADNIGYKTYLDLRARSRTLERSAAFGYWQPTIFGDHDAERAVGQVVTFDFFKTLGVAPMLGRDFDASEDTPETRNVVILSHGLWTRRFGADSTIVGKTINTGGLSRRVIGVMPASFDNVLNPQAEIWRPLGYRDSDPSACRTCRHLHVIGRARPGLTRDDVARELDALLKRIIAENPREYSSSGAITDGLQERVTSGYRSILLVLFGAALLVLLIATANVVNLQLARAVRRGEEFAVRAALGAGRRRIARQLVAEGLVMAAIGAALGVAIAALLLPLLVARLPEKLPRLTAIHLDWRALAFVSIAAAVIGVVIGLVPALGAGRAQLFDTLRGTSRTSAGGARHRVRAGLVVAEVALALMLVIGAGLLGRSLARLLDVNPGFDLANIVTVDVQAVGPAYATDAAVFANHDRLLAAVRAVPGVVDAALTSQLPLGGNIDLYGVRAQDKPLENPELAPSADRYTVTAAFLRTMRIPLLRGRVFTEQEAADSNAQLAVISDALARRIWGNEDPIGKFIRMGGEQRPWKQVIGIVGNIHHKGLDATDLMTFYVPERQWYYAENAMSLVVRTAGDPRSATGAIHEAVRSVDPLQPIGAIATMETVMERSTSQRRLGTLLFIAFGAIAMLLACAGIYGVLAGSVAERTREFGVRNAMGATPGAIVGLVLRRAGGLAGLGMVMGLAGEVALSRYLQSLLFGVVPLDPVSIAMAIVIVAGVCLAACLAPALRAARVDPMTALRSD